jgi:phage shock protein PspC (stress-responsive transcriptional regulator)
MPSKTRRLYRSRSERLLAGVCGGIGAYFDVDPVLIRVLFVVAALATGAGVLAYLLLLILTPLEPAPADGGEPNP